MSKNKKDNPKTQYKTPKKTKALIAILSTGLVLALGAAVAAPMIISKIKQKPSDATVFTVTFDTQGGPTVQPISVLKGEKVQRPYVDPWKKDGETYKVSKWLLNGQEYNFDTKVESNLTLTAVWTLVPPEVQFHTVKFMTDGTVYKTESIMDGDVAVEPVKPTKAGFKFSKWVKDSETQGYDFNTPVLGDITLNAVFDEVIVVTHTVTFHTNGFGLFADGSSEYVGTYNDKEYFIGISKPQLIPSSEDITHLGWVDASGNDLSLTQITTDMHAYAKCSVKEKYVNLNLSTEVETYIGDVEIKGQTEYSWKEKDNKNYGSIKKGLPIAVCDSHDPNQTYTFKNWSLTPQTDITKPNNEPADSEPISTTTVFYPQFTKDKATHEIILTMQLTGDQTLRSGSETIIVSYKEGTTPQTFEQINKPEVLDGTKQFEGYYHDAEYKNPWDPTTKIDTTLAEANRSIYVKMEEPYSDPEVTFAINDPGHVDEYKWVGNHEHIKCPVDTPLSSISVPNVYYKDAKENPDPTVGFTSKFYFKNWYYIDENDKPVDVDNGFVIKNSITLYAKFEQKTKVVFEVNQATSPSTETIYAIPSTKWVDLVKPDVTIDDPSTYCLVGWKTKNVGGEDLVLSSSSKISDIKLLDEEAEEKETVHVVPIISNQIHKINFSNMAVVDDEYKGTPSEHTEEVVLRGKLTAGVLYSQDTNIESQVNKPALPKTDDWTDPEHPTKINEDITFENKWQYKLSTSTQWLDVTEETTIPSSGSALTYDMRPIVKKNIKITFDVGDSAIGEFGPESHSSIQVGADTKFTDMYKPTIVIKEGVTNQTFSNWAKLVDGKYVDVEPNDTFTTATTLYARYKTLFVTSTIHFTVAESDIQDTTFPAQPINEENLFVVSKNHKSTENVKISDFAARIPTKLKHKFVSWGTYNNEGKLVAVDTTKVVPAGDPLVLYAMFEPVSTSYHKITIKQEPGVFIEGPKTFYAGYDENLNIKDGTTYEIQADDATISAYTVGQDIKGWATKEGSETIPVTSETKVQHDMEIFPVFDEDTVQPTVHFALVPPGEKVPENAGLSFYEDKEILINACLSDYVGTVWAPTAFKEKSQFIEWKIWDYKNEQLVSIEPTTRVTRKILNNGSLTLVATFIDESIFEGINGAYFYDEKEKQWAAIQSYTSSDNSCLKVQYADGKYGELKKSEFKYEIKFGKQTNWIPDHFMDGCNNWNNGGKPLIFPDTVTSIGKNVMFGCTSFNQPVTLTVKAGVSTTPALPLDPTHSGWHIFTIGENFMKNCYSFDSDLTICRIDERNDCFIVISEGFMSECQSLGKSKTSTLDFTGWQSIGFRNNITGATKYPSDSIPLSVNDCLTCLSTTRNDPYQIRMVVSNDSGTMKTLTWFNSVFPSLKNDSMYKRLITITGK